MSIQKGIIEALQNIGVYAYDIDIEAEDFFQLSLSEYIVDSIQFISFVVELEQIFSITVDDTLLTPDNFETLGDVYQIVINSINNSNSSNL